LKATLPFLNTRGLPLRQLAPFAQSLEANGIDYFWTFDQLTFITPRSLWTPETTPMAKEMVDLDSFHDPWVACAVAATATSDLGLLIGGTDATRRGPAELLQSMLSLADLTEGNAILCVGAGEMKQIVPFGYKRAERLKRLEDTLQLVKLLEECRGPIDYDGMVWQYRDAYIGCIRRHLPEFWTMGGGPKIVELAGKYADGYITVAPSAATTPERFAQHVTEIKKSLTAVGRDPDDFGFGCMFQVFIHDDPNALEAVIDHPVIKWYAAIAGRLNQADWLAEGIQPLFPLDWHYALKCLPSTVSAEEANSIISRVTPEMVRKSFLHGTPEQVAEQIAPYVDAGMNLMAPADCSPWGGQNAEELAAGHDRSLRLVQLVKDKAAPRKDPVSNR
jgi:phthiodiolone/phenolphthiodiolone dimycocerosates ketoreductase